MKVARAKIENFRKIESLELDFTNSFGEVQKVSILAGPNTSGKTTILDALAVCLGLGTELSFARPSFEVTPRLVRQGELYAKVTCSVVFTPEEIEATREVFRLTESGQVPDPKDGKVEVKWTYPDPKQKSRGGDLTFTPHNAWMLFKGRTKVARLLSTRLVDWSWFQRVGGIFTFDQQRTGLGRTIPREIWNIIGGAFRNGESDEENRRTSDPRTILLSLAVQSKFDPLPGAAQTDQFKLIKEQYNRVCDPHNLLDVRRISPDELDLRFSDGVNEYLYEELSSGEEMLLLFLISMVSQHVHKSIIFLDELELHLHPIWQRKMLHMLPQIGLDNQIIATTHSQYLREVAPPESVIDLGNLLNE